MNKILFIMFAVSILFITGCDKYDEAETDALLQKYKQNYRTTIEECYNQNQNNPEEFCHCIGGYAIINYPANNKMFCGNTQIGLPYTEISKIIA